MISFDVTSLHRCSSCTSGTAERLSSACCPSLYCSSRFSFFFSSRRRHTRWPRDWSSDVCSSDLNEGDVSFTFTSDSLGAGAHEVTLTSDDLSASTSFTVTEDPVVYDPVASVSPEEVTEAELADSGVTITGADFPAGAEVALSVGGSEVDSGSANNEGEVSLAHARDSLGAREHQATLASGDLSASASFTVVEDPVVYDPVASVSPEEVTEAEVADSGVTITGADFPAGAEVALSVGGSEVDSATANNEGDV